MTEQERPPLNDLSVWDEAVEGLNVSPPKVPMGIVDAALKRGWTLVEDEDDQENKEES